VTNQATEQRFQRAEECLQAREYRRLRISQIEDSLARPCEEGPDWDRRRKQLQRELDDLLARN